MLNLLRRASLARKRMTFGHSPEQPTEDWCDTARSGADKGDLVLIGGETTPVRFQRWASAAQHAAMFYDWLEANGYVDGCLLSRDLRALYPEFCAHLGLMPRKWNGVARALALLTSDGRKIYARVGDHKLRVFPLPAGRPAEVGRNAGMFVEATAA